MTFNVEVVLKNRDFAVTEAVSVPYGDPSGWDDAAVRDVLVEILRAISRVDNAEVTSERMVVLQGFSWIVEPAAGGGGVVIAIEIPMGAAVAGPFALGQPELDSMIGRVLRNERQLMAPRTVH